MSATVDESGDRCMRPARAGSVGKRREQCASVRERLAPWVRKAFIKSSMVCCRVPRRDMYAKLPVAAFR